MFAQVALLMPIDTTVTYQYRYGVGTEAAYRALYNGGGLARLYSGVLPALVQGPLSRFGDTASNAVVLAVLEARPETRELPIVAQTLMGSILAASWRVVLMPLDVCKTTAQVHGSVEGWREVRARFKESGAGTLWRGSSASFLSTLCGHLPWYTTFNFLNKYMPHFGSSGPDRRRERDNNGDGDAHRSRVTPKGGKEGGGLSHAPSLASSGKYASSSLSSDTPPASKHGVVLAESSSAPSVPLGKQKESSAAAASSSDSMGKRSSVESWQRPARHGLIGFTASIVSDCCTNSLRVVKAIRQAEGVSYEAAVRLVLAEDGVVGLLGRGLKTRILANGFQGLLFTALWKSLEEAIEHRCFGVPVRQRDTS